MTFGRTFDAEFSDDMTTGRCRRVFAIGPLRIPLGPWTFFELELEAE